MPDVVEMIIDHIALIVSSEECLRFYEKLGFKEVFDYVLPIPRTNEMVAPVLGAIQLQLLAYYTAKEKGCDIDKPRNLAKSVTVE